MLQQTENQRKFDFQEQEVLLFFKVRYLNFFLWFYFHLLRGSPLEVFLGKDDLKICSKFTGEHTFQNT